MVHYILLSMLFLYYFLNRTPQLLKYDNGIDQTNLRKNQILDIQIPIIYPNNSIKSLEKQNKIVSILNEFEILANSISEGLNRELELRQQQYDYYRDLLLTFPKQDAEA